jgi:hypothetical protein
MALPQISSKQKVNSEIREKKKMGTDLTRGGADTACELWEVVGLVQVVQRLPPLVLNTEINIFVLYSHIKVY